jgi:hypothetical protein
VSCLVVAAIQVLCLWYKKLHCIRPTEIWFLVLFGNYLKILLDPSHLYDKTNMTLLFLVQSCFLKHSNILISSTISWFSSESEWKVAEYCTCISHLVAMYKTKRHKTLPLKNIRCCICSRWEIHWLKCIIILIDWRLINL